MRVAINLAPISSTSGGFSRYAGNMLASLAALDDQNTYFVIHNSRAKGLCPSKASCFRPVVVSIPERLGFYWDQILTPRVVSRLGVDVLHCPVSAPLAVKGPRQIVTIHDLTFLRHPETMTRVARYYWRRYMRAGLNRCDHVVTVSHFTRREVMHVYGLPDSKISVIYPFDVGVFASYRDREDPTALSRYGIRRPYVLFVGTLEPRKNITTLVRAFGIIARESSDLNLVLVGRPGWNYREIHDAVRQLRLYDRVVFAGHVPDCDLAQMYKAAEAVVLPSLYEGFGLPPLEAMTFGVPVLVSNVGSLPEVVGDAAMVADCTTEVALADSMLRLLYDEALRNELRKKGPIQAARFDTALGARQLLSIYDRVVTRG